MLEQYVRDLDRRAEYAVPNDTVDDNALEDNDGTSERSSAVEPRQETVPTLEEMLDSSEERALLKKHTIDKWAEMYSKDHLLKIHYETVNTRKETRKENEQLRAEVEALRARLEDTATEKKKWMTEMDEILGIKGKAAVDELTIAQLREHKSTQEKKVEKMAGEIIDLKCELRGVKGNTNIDHLTITQLREHKSTQEKLVEKMASEIADLKSELRQQKPLPVVLYMRDEFSKTPKHMFVKVCPRTRGEYELLTSLHGLLANDTVKLPTIQEDFCLNPPLIIPEPLSVEFHLLIKVLFNNRWQRYTKEEHNVVTMVEKWYPHLVGICKNTEIASSYPTLACATANTACHVCIFHKIKLD